MKAVRAEITRTGGPEVIEWREVELAAPGPGEVTLVHGAIGINFIDTYHRSGVYPIEMPGTLGLEAAGTIAAVGAGVTGFKAGDRAATLGPERGAYASARNVAAASLFALPEHIDDRTAAASLLKGGTAEFLVERCAKVQPGWPVLVHAAAGGVGLLLVQWLKQIGAEVIGTVGSAAKAELAKAAGADHVIIYTSEAVAPRVRELTGGAGVRVTFDGIGMATWEASLDSTGTRGLVVSYGNADAPVTGVALGQLSAKGSLFVTRPMLFAYYAEPAERAAGAERIWQMIGSGKVEITVGQSWPLHEAAAAHRALEARETTGSSLLIP
jgi:NADPH:quinone reductase